MTCAVRLIVRCDGVTSFVEPGESLRFGRQPADNDVVIGSARKEGTEDLLVSRIAGRIESREMYRATDPSGSSVALKVFRSDRALSESFRKRLGAEAELAIRARGAGIALGIGASTPAQPNLGNPQVVTDIRPRDWKHVIVPLATWISDPAAFDSLTGRMLSIGSGDPTTVGTLFLDQIEFAVDV